MRDIFRHTSDRARFLALILHCLPQGSIPSYSRARKIKKEHQLTRPGEGLVDVLCYCLMSNHVHFLLRENVDNGISRYMQRLLNSYARYFNVSSQRSGSLFVNPFKAVLVVNDNQLLHVGRYIHLNPYVAHMVEDPFGYRWSSLSEYLSAKAGGAPRAYARGTSPSGAFAGANTPYRTPFIHGLIPVAFWCGVTPVILN